MLTAADTPAAVRSWAAGDRKPGRQIWQSLADAGVTGLMVPAGQGGLGADPVDLVIACEEIGHHAVPGPVAESIGAVPVLLAACDLALTSPHARADSAGYEPAERVQGSPSAAGWLRQLAAGELIATLAAPPWLPFAAGTEVAGLVLFAEPDRLALGVAGARRRSVDAARTVAEVAPGDVIAEGPAVATGLARALDAGALACAAQLLGAGRALLELAAGHALQRVQFGQPVGSFQAVKHHLADAAIGLEFARPLLHGAAVAIGACSADAARDVSAAKVACAQAASLASRVALQVHGAIGYTGEHDVSLYLTQVLALAPSWGSQPEHRRRVLAALTGQDR
jgi:alkylation response protein AidB-like acyl-CoA dehydrogenase